MRTIILGILAGVAAVAFVITILIATAPRCGPSAPPRIDIADWFNAGCKGGGR